MRFNRKGFTLIELIIVIIIIGILAAIAAPMMSGNVNRARRSEAIASLGAIRTAIRLYTVGSGGTAPVNMTDLQPYINSAGTDLNGQNYNGGNYSFNTTMVSASSTTAGQSVNMNIVTGTVDNP